MPGADRWPAVEWPAVSLTELNPAAEPVRIAEREPVNKKLKHFLLNPRHPQVFRTSPKFCAAHTGETWHLVRYQPAQSSHTQGLYTGNTPPGWTDVSSLYNCLSSLRCLWLWSASSTARTQLSDTGSGLHAWSCCDAPTARRAPPHRCGAPCAGACRLCTRVHHLNKKGFKRGSYTVEQ